MKNIRVYFDNDVSDHLTNIFENDLNIRKLITKSFSSGPLVLYLSLDLIDELVSIVETNRPQKLFQNAALLSGLMRGRWLSDIEDIIVSELNGNTKIFPSALTSRKAEQRLNEMTKGIIPPRALETARRLRETKQQWNSYYKNIQDQIRDIADGISRDEDFQSFHAKLRNKSILFKLIENLQVGITELKKKDIIEKPNSFPYCHLLSLTYSAMLYRYYVMDRNINNEPGLYDGRHLVYMHGLNLFVSGDRKLRDTFGMVFQDNPGKKALSPEALVEWCSNYYNSSNK
jgi:hypothetical protein